MESSNNNYNNNFDSLLRGDRTPDVTNRTENTEANIDGGATERISQAEKYQDNGLYGSNQ